MHKYESTKHDTPKMSEENNAKKLEFKFVFYLVFSEKKLDSVLPLEKCVHCRISFSDFIGIYMSYINIRTATPM